MTFKTFCMRPCILPFLILGFISGCKSAPDKATTIAKPDKSVSMNCAPQTTDKAWYTTGTKAPKLKGLEGIDFKISTSNAEAQDYFNQGMMLSYGFNHAEAARSFFLKCHDSTPTVQWLIGDSRMC